MWYTADYLQHQDGVGYWLYFHRNDGTCQPTQPNENKQMLVLVFSFGDNMNNTEYHDNIFTNSYG